MMIDYDFKHPSYLFYKNKGYATKEHINAIKETGLCPIHRKTFCRKILSPEQISFDF